MPEPRIAVVAGAARGIGAAVARRMAAEGRTLAVVDRDLEAARRLSDELNGSRQGASRAFGADTA